MARFDLQSILSGRFLGRAWTGGRTISRDNPRLLVIDGAGLLYDRIVKVVPAGVELNRLKTFSDAEDALVEDPPDAAVFSIVPCFAMWARTTLSRSHSSTVARR